MLIILEGEGSLFIEGEGRLSLEGDGDLLLERKGGYCNKWRARGSYLWTAFVYSSVRMDYCRKFAVCHNFCFLLFSREEKDQIARSTNTPLSFLLITTRNLSEHFPIHVTFLFSSGKLRRYDQY